MHDLSDSGLKFQLPAPFYFRAGNKFLDLSRPAIMGILNLSADSFYSGSRFEAEGNLLASASAMLEEGASILDLGALSSRPGSAEITEEAEIRLLIPGLKLLRKAFPEAILSADVFRPAVASAALAEGADIINNIQGIHASDQLLKTVAAFRAGYILMHSRGIFAEMHQANAYTHLVNEIASDMAIAIDRAHQAGVTDVVADPGFGFSKNATQNFTLFRELHYLQNLLGCPVLAGVSRKSMIYRTLNGSPEEALNGTTALHMAALVQGVHILRVHDVKPARECIQLFEKLCLQEL
jgi:dihydropteroate synthase